VAPSLAATFPEAGVISLPHTDSGTIRGVGAAEACADAASGADAVLIGPGLDDPEEAAALLEGLLPHLDAEAHLVLDAFSLGVLPDFKEELASRTVSPVLTPNADELGRLLEREVEPEHDDVVDAAREYASCVTAQAMIADREGRRWRVPSGHSGLATAGSGDVLAGLVVGLLARSAEPAQAACWGTYLHAMAGERLASTVGEVGFLARELVDEVPAVLAELS
jgi:ADP-dependent NAD(P)H-hydrate dehydratase